VTAPSRRGTVSALNCLGEEAMARDAPSVLH